MAVYDRSWRAYDGPRTRERTRFLVLPRYALREVFRGRLFTVVFAVSFLPPLCTATWIYLVHNLSALAALGLKPGQLATPDTGFFAVIAAWQAFFFGGLVTLLAGPGLVSPDLSHNGLPLYLSRPFSRVEYVVGKATALVVLLSAVTWVPLGALFLLQSSLEGWSWFTSHGRLAVAIATGSGVFIAVATLLALAASALAKRKLVAQVLLLAVVLGGGWAGASLQVLLDTSRGFAVSLSHVLVALWEALFGVQIRAQLDPWTATLAASGFCLVSMWVLWARLRAYEVVR